VLNPSQLTPPQAPSYERSKGFTFWQRNEKARIAGFFIA
jgi:hypothetical protein